MATATLLAPTLAPSETPGERERLARFEKSGIKRDELPRLLGFSQRAIANWVAGQPPADAASRRLRELDRFITALSGLVGEKQIGAWLREPNEGFAGSTPLQVIERGEWDRIWLMIHEAGSGQPG